jgi:hypothetical protein
MQHFFVEGGRTDHIGKYAVRFPPVTDQKAPVGNYLLNDLFDGMRSISLRNKPLRCRCLRPSRFAILSHSVRHLSVMGIRQPLPLLNGGKLLLVFKRCFITKRETLQQIPALGARRRYAGVPMTGAGEHFGMLLIELQIPCFKNTTYDRRNCTLHACSGAWPRA